MVHKFTQNINKICTINKIANDITLIINTNNILIVTHTYSQHEHHNVACVVFWINCNSLYMIVQCMNTTSPVLGFITMSILYF